ncbi:endonuclease/exonuclease/phosphatase family protein [Phaeocystidibacter luteus]|uniref:Endonuclease/exonuclease/phosphatase family protein n=1 Tax=Phaeocystidibacter luteus TaxID=911197 RepID=A0A6N6RDE4_9FLAO|nr:endonuclease/exonuclease/phosphatase family protein [Phaeocystidibacter luteus]KAB2807307.1 endonuclease/exonuclease/phosphatase family protein [Phaeocystidibacter luteus]
MTKKKRKWSRRLLIFVQLPLLVSYIVSALACHFNPASAPLMGLAGLAFPILLIGQLLFTGFWFLRGRRFAWVSLVITLIGWPHFANIYQWNGTPATQATGVRVMTYNIHYWSPMDAEIDLDSARQELSTLIRDVNPDILFLQENKDIPRSRNLPFMHKLHVPVYENSTYGYAIYSKYPVLRHTFHTFESRRAGYRGLLSADLLIGTDTIRAINVHLVNTSLIPEDYQTLAANESPLSSEQIEEEGKDILRKLGRSYRIRGNQAEELALYVEQSPYPVILCGDFNDTPTSFAYKRISDLLNDAFVAMGTGSGDTYNKVNVIPLRIDYIFTSTEFSCDAFSTVPALWSDHKPIYADFTLN